LAQVTQPNQNTIHTNQIIAIFSAMLIPTLARTILDGTASQSSILLELNL
jgi:hypothetical protein